MSEKREIAIDFKDLLNSVNNIMLNVTISDSQGHGEYTWLKYKQLLIMNEKKYKHTRLEKCYHTNNHLILLRL